MPPAADESSFKGPPGTCDCHMHVFGDPVRYPYSAVRRNSPPADALEKFLDDYLALARSLGIERMVFVQPSTYGRDNACMIDAMQALGANVRGIVDIGENTPESGLAAPAKPVVALCGDGCFGMVPHVLATAVEYQIPVTWVIWNNGGLGVVRPDGTSRYTSRWMHHPTGKLLPPDYAAIARAYGAAGVRVEAPSELGDALKEAIESGQPTVLDVQVDPQRTRVGVSGWSMPPNPPTKPEYPRASFRDR